VAGDKGLALGGVWIVGGVGRLICQRWVELEWIPVRMAGAAVQLFDDAHDDVAVKKLTIQPP
jgi:hypothetical protein